MTGSEQRPAAVLLPGVADAGPADLERTLDSVRGEAGAVLALAGTLPPEAHERLEAEGVAVVEPAEALASAELLAFARIGDSWRAGALAARRRPLAAHPVASLGVAGHARVDRDGEAVLTIGAPTPPIDPHELLLRAQVEASSVLVRSAALAPEALAHIARPHGDVVVWSRLARDGGLVTSGEIAADVLIDPDRHSSAPAARAEALLEAATAPDLPEDGGAITLRRDLLRRLYLDGTASPTGVDLLRLTGRGDLDARTVAVIADLQWALERQRDALAAERVGWPRGDIADDERLGPFPDRELFELRSGVAAMGAEVAVRDAKIERLEAEVYRRDAIIANLTGAAGEHEAAG